MSAFGKVEWHVIYMTIMIELTISQAVVDFDIKAINVVINVSHFVQLLSYCRKVDKGIAA